MNETNETRETVISVKEISKEYRYYKSNVQRIQGQLLNRDSGSVIKVLDSVSFDIRRGEKVALMGARGSGRSTVLRILAGLIGPDAGEVFVDGKVTGVFDYRLCFERNLSGKDNYLMQTTVLGWSREEIRKREDAIFEFADLADVRNEPLRTYKAGGAGRLGFAIATEFRPEIMLFDENFSLGGADYTEKCAKRLKRLVKGKDCTLLITSNLGAVIRSLCSRAIVLNDGVIAFDGEVRDAIKYFKENCKAGQNDEEKVKSRIAENAESEERDDLGDDF